MTKKWQVDHVKVVQSNGLVQNNQSTLTDCNNEYRSSDDIRYKLLIDAATTTTTGTPTTTNTGAYRLNENSEIVKLKKDLMIREHESIQEMRREKHCLEMELLRCDLEFKKIEHRKKLECLDKKLKEY